jgi:hypothetical protein
MEEKTINCWLIPSPSNAIFSEMYLTKPLPPLPLHVQQEQTARPTPRSTKTYQIPSYQDQHHISDISDPGMMDDLGSSISGASLEDNSPHTPVEIGTQIWDSYWSSPREPSTPSYLPPRPPLLHTQSSNLSQNNRNFASSDLPKLNSPAVTNRLQGSDAVRPPRYVSRPKQTRPHTYSPFPPVPPLPPQNAHSSWPLREEPRSNRPRAQTTPSKFKARSPSNLSTCNTFDGKSQPSSGEGSPLYMSISSRTPLSAPPVPPLPPIPQLDEPVEEEVSHFDFDSDEDQEDDESAGIKLKRLLHIRTSSSNHDDGAAEKPRIQRLKTKSLRRLRKSLSDAASDANETLKGVFRPKK